MLEGDFDSAPMPRKARVKRMVFARIAVSGRRPKMEPIVVRHQPTRTLVHDPDICMRCGDLGHYFLINPSNPEDIFTIECHERNCADHTRDGVPEPTPRPDDTEPIVITHDGVRGICYGNKGITRIGNCISGTIGEGCPSPKKMP